MTEQANTPFTAIRPAFGTLVVVLTLAMAACTGKESSPAGPTPPSPPNFAAMASAEAASPKPPLPVPVWTRTDLSTWPKAPPSDMGSFVVDVGNGEIWRPALASLSTSYPTDAWVRSWSPGGEALVAVNASYGTTAASAVYVGAPGGSLRHLLDTPGSVMSANWSPDGDVVALESWSQTTGVNVRAVLLVNTTTGALVNDLTQLGFGILGWSSDGRYLALSSDDLSSPKVTIWNRQTGETVQIASPYASWSHQGHRLAYVSPHSTADPAPPIELHVRDLDTGDDRVVATDHGQPGDRFRWSPDDRFVALSAAVSTKVGASVSTKSTLRVADTAGSQAGAVIPDGVPGGWLDNRTLYFDGNVCNGFDVFTVRADGSQLVNYTRSPEIDLDPWSAPDGRSIAFTTAPGRLRLLSLADGAIRDLADLAAGTLSLGIGPTGAGEPWSPDGRYLAVAVAGAHGLCQD